MLTPKSVTILEIDSYCRHKSSKKHHRWGRDIERTFKKLRFENLSGVGKKRRRHLDRSLWVYVEIYAVRVFSVLSKKENTWVSAAYITRDVAYRCDTANASCSHSATPARIAFPQPSKFALISHDSVNNLKILDFFRNNCLFWIHNTENKNIGREYKRCNIK